MKFCQHCGKELLDDAVICVGCGCPIENQNNKKEQRVSVFKKYRKQWLIALELLFVVCVVVVILMLTSEEFIRARDLYAFLHTDLGQLGKNISTSGAIEWKQDVEAAKSSLMPYYIGIGLSGVVALTSLVGVFIIKKKDN